MRVLYYLSFGTLVICTGACAALCVRGFVTGDYLLFIVYFIPTFINAQTIAMLR